MIENNNTVFIFIKTVVSTAMAVYVRYSNTTMRGRSYRDETHIDLEGKSFYLMILLFYKKNYS